jgi:hypothetical protein
MTMSLRQVIADVIKRFAARGGDTLGAGAKDEAARVKQDIVRLGAAVRPSGAKADSGRCTNALGSGAAAAV